MGRLPDQLDEMINSMARGWDGPYAKATDLLDPWDSPIHYRVIGGHEPGFELISMRGDRALGGSGDNPDFVVRRQVSLVGPPYAGSPPRRTCTPPKPHRQ